MSGRARVRGVRALCPGGAVAVLFFVLVSPVVRAHQGEGAGEEGIAASEGGGEEIIFFEEGEEETLPSEPLRERPEPRQWKGGLKLGGYWENETGIDTVQENGQEDMIDYRSKIFGYGSYQFTDNISMNLSILALYWALEGGDDRQSISFDLYEAYLAFAFDKADLFVGQKTVKWGLCDILSPIDAVNPVNYRTFIDPDSEDLVIPLPIVEADLYHRDLVFEVFYMPVFQSAVFELAGADLSLIRTEEGQIELPASLDPIFTRTLETAAARKVDFREQRFLFGEAGAKIGYRMGSSRAELYYLSSREDFPVIKYRAPEDSQDLGATGDMEFEFNRYEMYGLAYKTHLSQVDLRAELAFSRSRSLTRWKDQDGDGVLDRTDGVERPWQAVSMEADYIDPGGDFILVLGAERITYIDAPEKLLVAADDNLFFIFALRFFLMNNSMSPELRAVNMQSDSNRWYISPRMAYRFRDRCSLTAGVNVFAGSGASGSGQAATTAAPITVVSNNNQVFFSLRWFF